MKNKKIKHEAQKPEPVRYTGYYVSAHFSYRCKAAIINYDEDLFFKSKLKAQSYFDKCWHFYQKAVEERKLVSFDRVALIPVRMGDNVLDYIT